MGIHCQRLHSSKFDRKWFVFFSSLPSFRLVRLLLQRFCCCLFVCLVSVLSGFSNSFCVLGLHSCRRIHSIFVIVPLFSRTEVFARKKFAYKGRFLNFFFYSFHCRCYFIYCFDSVHHLGSPFTSCPQSIFEYSWCPCAFAVGLVSLLPQSKPADECAMPTTRLDRYRPLYS